MDIEEVRRYCMGLPFVTEDMAFGEDCVLLRVCDKIFACISMTRPDLVTVKCDADRAVELRERYAAIEPAWHWNKKYWNQIDLLGGLPDELILGLIRHSYAEVVRKLPRRTVAQYPGMADVCE